MPKYGNCVHAQLRGANLSFRTALTEAAGNQDAVDVLEEGRGILALEHLALDPVEIDRTLLRCSVGQRLDQGL